MSHAPSTPGSSGVPGDPAEPIGLGDGDAGPAVPGPGAPSDAGPASSRPARRHRPWYARTDSLVLGWALAAGVVALFQQQLPAAPWLLVHLMLLGMATSAILVWSQHFADVFTRPGPPADRRLLATRLFAHTGGAVAVVVGVSTALWPLTVAGATVVAGAVVWHVIVIAGQLRGTPLAHRLAPLLRFYIVAGLMLGAGIVLGVVMAHPDTTVQLRDRLMVAHVVFNVLGWIGLSVMGTAIQLWPAILRAEVRPGAASSAPWVLWCCTAGILVAGTACILGARPAAVIGLTLYLAGLAPMLFEFSQYPRRAGRARYPAWSMVAALGWFAGCVVALALSIAVLDQWDAVGTVLGALLIPFALGFAAQLISAALSHLMPTLIGRDPARLARMNDIIGGFGAFRVVLVNVALVVSLFPVGDAIRFALLAVAALALFATIPLSVIAVRRSRPSAGAVGADEGAADTNASAATAVANPDAAAVHAASADAPTTASGTARPWRRFAPSAVAAAGVVALAVAAGALAGSPQSNGGAAAPTGATTRVRVVMKDMRFSPDTVRVPAGNRLVIQLVDDDAQVHDLTLASGAASPRLNRGQSATLDAGVIRQDLDGWCSVLGHRQMGMVMKIVATDARGATGAGGR